MFDLKCYKVSAVNKSEIQNRVVVVAFVMNDRTKEKSDIINQR